MMRQALTTLWMAFAAVPGPVLAVESDYDLPLGFPAALAPVMVGANSAAYEVDVLYTESTIFNPVTGEQESVRLRTFQANSTDPLAPYAGPRIDVRPGETVRLRVRNALPENDPSCMEGHANINIPHCFNTTNMHTHGMWVSPSGNSDNVLLSIPPGTVFDYEYNIPEDHPSGTYFYHPHHHGSTALQVSSGLAGALIVRGDRLPRRGAGGGVVNGDIDTLLKTPDGQPFAERVVLVQQIPYACRDEDGVIRTRDDETWWCADGDTGTIEQYDQFGQSTWDRSGRFNSLNGRIMPTFTGAIAGNIERWRLIHAGVRDTVKVRFQKLKAGAAEVRPNGQTALEQQAYVDEVCNGPMLPVVSIALDGQTRGLGVVQSDTILQPGYREDVLVAFPEAGTYCVIDGEIPAAESVSGRPQERALLGYVRVEAGLGNPDIQAALVEAAGSHMPEDVRTRIAADLEDGLKLTAFVDHADITNEELTGKQTLGFRYHNVNLDPDPPRYQHEVGYLGQDIGGKMILVNSQPFDPDRIDRVLQLGGADEWTLASFWGGHPFHIHINPFQIVSIIDANGNDVSGPGTGQYAGLKGTWKDTLFIEEGYVFKVRSRYERYIGDFVLHCHILDHEDKGMMQNVRIALPN